jgi:adenylylsulfate kinase
VSQAIWITGLPGSGKSTIADAFRERHPEYVILRMDEFRKVVTPEPAYSDAEREMTYRALVYTAKVLTDQDHSVIIDATGNMRRWRQLARELMPNFTEVYLKCSIPECRQREVMRKDTHAAPKDIYRKGAEGWPVPGVNVPYEEPLRPELTIDTEFTAIDKAVQMIEGIVL